MCLMFALDRGLSGYVKWEATHQVGCWFGLLGSVTQMRESQLNWRTKLFTAPATRFAIWASSTMQNWKRIRSMPSSLDSYTMVLPWVFLASIVGWYCSLCWTGTRSTFTAYLYTLPIMRWTAFSLRHKVTYPRLFKPIGITFDTVGDISYTWAIGLTLTIQHITLSHPCYKAHLDAIALW